MCSSLKNDFPNNQPPQIKKDLDITTNHWQLYLCNWVVGNTYGFFLLISDNSQI